MLTGWSVPADAGSPRRQEDPRDAAADKFPAGRQGGIPEWGKAGR